MAASAQRLQRRRRRKTEQSEHGKCEHEAAAGGECGLPHHDVFALPAQVMFMRPKPMDLITAHLSASLVERHLTCAESEHKSSGAFSVATFAHRDLF